MTDSTLDQIVAEHTANVEGIEDMARAVLSCLTLLRMVLKDVPDDQQHGVSVPPNILRALRSRLEEGLEDCPRKLGVLT